MEIFFHSLNSCGMRNVNIQQLKDYFKENGHHLIEEPEAADYIVIWTCAFRQDVKDNSLYIIKKYEFLYDDKVIVAGCLPDIDGRSLGSVYNGKIVPWKNQDEEIHRVIDGLFGNIKNVPRILTKERMYTKLEEGNNVTHQVDTPYVGRYLQLYIAEGCRFECSYCSERLAFPEYRSFDEDKIIEQCLQGIEGIDDPAVVLLADSTGDYGWDTGSNLPTLINRLISLRPELKIAIQDLNPYHFVYYYEEFVEFIQRGVIAHFQIPIQSANDRILKEMKRPYSTSDIKKVYGALNNLGFMEFDCHIIAGFPSETDDEFQETLDFVIEHRPKYVLASGCMVTPWQIEKKKRQLVDQTIIRSRLKKAEDAFQTAGIIYNIDNDELSNRRFKKMNMEK